MTTNESELPSPVDAGGNLKFSRFSKLKKAHATLKKLDDQDEKHSRDRMVQKGMINGNRPYNAERMKANGQAWRCNVNFREAEAIRDMNAGAYWSMMNDVPAFLDIAFKDPTLDPTLSFFWSNIIAEEYTELLTNWRAWHYHVSVVIQEFLIPGIGAFHFKNQFTWQPKSVKRDDIRFNVNDPSNPEDMGIVFIRDTMNPYELYRAVESNEAARNMGWNPDMVRRALIAKYVDRTLSGVEQSEQAGLEKIQQMFKNGDTDTSVTELQDLNVVWLYVREPSGKYSEYIFVEDPQIPDYLFQHVEKYDQLSNVFIPFFYSIGDGDVGSVRGQGNRMFGIVEYGNRLMCGLMDGAWLASSMIMKNTGGPNRSLTIERIGPITLLPNDVNPIQSSFTPQFGQLAQMKSMLEMMQNNNNGVYKRQLTLPDGGPRTATEAQGQMERDTQFSGQQVGNFYIYWGMLHQEILRRLLATGWTEVSPGYKERQEFISAVLKRGVPRKLLSMDAMKVKAMQSIGNGSNMMKKMSTNRIYSMSGGFDEIGRQNAQIDAVAAEVGYRRASRYITNLNRNLIPTSETSVAMLENNDMAQGQPVVVGADQKHLLHALTHLQPLMETVQQYMNAAQTAQPMDPRPLVPFWQGAIQHIAQHIQRMNTDPRYKGDIKMLEEAVAQIIPVVKQAMMVAKSQNDDERQMQQQQMAAMAQQMQSNPALMLKIRELEGRLQIAAREAEADMAMKQAKTEQAMVLKEASAAQKMRIKESEAQRRAAASPAAEPAAELPPLDM